MDREKVHHGHNAVALLAPRDEQGRVRTRIDEDGTTTAILISKKVAEGLLHDSETYSEILGVDGLFLPTDKVDALGLGPFWQRAGEIIERNGKRHYHIADSLLADEVHARLKVIANREEGQEPQRSR